MKNTSRGDLFHKYRISLDRIGVKHLGCGQCALMETGLLMKWVGCIAFLAFVVILIWLLKIGYVLGNAQTSAIATPTYMLSVVSTLLTAVTVVLAALGISIGLIAAYTLRGIKNEALEVARMEAREALADKNIDTRIATYAFRGIDEGQDSDSESEDQTDSPSP